MHVCSQCCGRLLVSSWLGSEGDPAFTLTGTVYTCEHTLNTHYAHADRWPDTHSHIHTHTRTHAHTCDRSVGEVRRKVKIFRWYTGNSVRLRLTKQFLCTTRCAGHLPYIFIYCRPCYRGYRRETWSTERFAYGHIANSAPEPYQATISLWALHNYHFQAN